MRVNLHSRFVFISRLPCGSPGSHELVSSLVGNPVIISAKVEVEFCLFAARILCFGNAPELIIPSVCSYGLHLVTGKIPSLLLEVDSMQNPRLEHTMLAGHRLDS